jgi:hypothetical protein
MTHRKTSFYLGLVGLLVLLVAAFTPAQALWPPRPDASCGDQLATCTAAALQEYNNTQDGDRLNRRNYQCQASYRICDELAIE